MRKKVALFSVLALPFLILGFVFNFFVKKEKLAESTESTFFQKVYADDPSTWTFIAQGCEGGGCCGGAGS